MEKVFQYLRDNKIFYLATVDGDKPQVRPFGVVSIIVFVNRKMGHILIENWASCKKN